MALEGLPTSAASSAPGAASTAGVSQSFSGGASPSDSAESGFLGIFTGALASASAGDPIAAGGDRPSDPTGDDDTSDDEIGFEDLSEFLTDVRLPGAIQPQPSPSRDADSTVDMEFARGDDLLNELFALSTEARRQSLMSASSGDAVKDPATVTNVTSASQTALDSTVLSIDDIQAFSPPVPHALPAHHITSSASHAATAELRSPVGTQGWSDELGHQITWMTRQGLETASLKLSPEHLGPIEVRISVQDGQASVWFGAAQADTRAAIEQALPRLRELFSSQGLSLADSGVFRDAPRQHPQSTSTSLHAVIDTDEPALVTPITTRGTNILDLYA